MPILYIAPWVDLGGSDSATTDWFELLDRTRWAASLITTTPSPNRRLRKVEAYAEEIWDLPDLMPGGAFPEFILGFIESRAIRVVHIMNSRLAFDLLPDMTCLPEPPAVVVELRSDEPDQNGYVRYVARRYGNLIDAFSVAGDALEKAIVECEIPHSRVARMPASSSAKEVAFRQDALYEKLLSERVASSHWRSEELFGEGALISLEPAGEPPPPPPLGRDPLPERTVGVVVPCYRHGIFLDACIDSIKAQTLKPAAIVVVDDGSPDPETIEALARLDDDPEVTVLRQPENAGPSAARNRAIGELETSYVLPIDADDQLLPDALERMLAQLETAPKEVGFVYPAWRHIGNQEGEVKPPAYNPWLLMEQNYCAAPALFDRRIFAESGVHYAEEIVVGHEDWDLILQLVERGVWGIPADGPTFLYRRQGFSRVNAVDYGPDAFERTIERRHPHLYSNRDAIKARWAPALSVVLLADPADEWRADDLPGLERQTCTDFEVLARTELREGVRSVGGMYEADRSPVAWLQGAVDSARGRWVLSLPHSLAAVLGVSSFVERVIHSFVANEDVCGLVLADAPNPVRAFFAQLDDAERLSARPAAVAFERPLWGRAPEIPLGLEHSPLADLAVGLAAIGPVQWRVAPVEGQRPSWASYPSERGGDAGQIDINLPAYADRSEAAMRHMVAHQGPRLPELTPGTVRRWKQSEPWTPPQTQLLYRFVDPKTQLRRVLHDETPPAGYVLERVLGCTHILPLPGTGRVVHGNHSFRLTDQQGELAEGEYEMGYVEREPLVQMEPLALCRVRDTGQETLVAGGDDPLMVDSDPLETLGWLEPCPILPRARDVLHTGPWAVVSLRRTVDDRTWRRHYTVGSVGEQSDGVEVGSLCRHPGPELIPLRLRPDGRLDSELCMPGRASRDPRKIVRWVTDPLRADSSSAGRMRGIASRVRHLALHHRARRMSGADGETIGYLPRQSIAGCSTLYSTIHPVTGDQLVTRFPQEAIEAGYLMDGILGAIFDPPSPGTVAQACEPS